MITASEVIDICENQGIEFVEYTTSGYGDEEFFFIHLFHNRHSVYVFNVDGGKVTEVEISKEDLKKVFRHFGITKKLFSCAMYPIVEHPTQFEYNPITFELIR